MKDFGEELEEKDFKKWLEILRKAAVSLLNVRPTEPMAQNGIKFIFKELHSYQPKDTLTAKSCLRASAYDYLLLMEDAAKIIIETGKKVIESGNRIFTHCHSWLVEQILIRAFQSKKFQVFNTETRPLYQGRIMAKNYSKQKFP